MLPYSNLKNNIDFVRLNFIETNTDASLATHTFLNRTKGCFWVNTAIEMAPTDSEVTAIAKKIMTDTENAFYKAIKKGQEQGVFTTTHTARSLAKFALNAMSGLRVNVKLDASEKIFDDIMNICLTVLKS